MEEGTEIPKERIRHLRQNPTDAEKIVWRHLRAKLMSGFKFRRQFPIGRYVVDFVCLSRRLIIEIDGGQHSADDGERTEWLRAQGFEIVRFWNHEVLKNIDGVLLTIQIRVETPPPLDLLPRGEEV